MQKPILLTNSSIHTPKGSLERSSRPWGLALLWLSVLGPFFLISYGLSNGLAAHNLDVSSFVFSWEHSIPFIPWTIIPYWSIDLLYISSFFICTSHSELNSHAKRLITAQIIAVSCFILMPMTFSFSKPETTGFNGLLYTALSLFDQPYNQAPSLHITFLIILWVLYLRHLPQWLKWPFRIWNTLIGISVLTTYQHHFIDVPTGALLGWLCIWLWPFDHKSPLKAIKVAHLGPQWKIATVYLVMTLALYSVALYNQGMALWLLWPAFSLLLVSLNYLVFDAQGFQKDSTGDLSLAARWLFFPYILGAYLNSRIWTREAPEPVEIVSGVYLGRIPSSLDLNKNQFDTILDMSAEFSKPTSQTNTTKWHSIPNLDLITPSKKSLLYASDFITEQESNGSILVCCALGYSRSALAIISWLLISNRANNIEYAINTVRKHRPDIVIRDSAISTLNEIAKVNEAINLKKVF